MRPFTDKQIELVKNFAAQAVIAIENTRLLKELRQRTDDLSEALEQQTATSEVLQVISSSPGELGPVFNAMLENATRICDAGFGGMFRCEGGEFEPVAYHNVPEILQKHLTERGRIKPRPGSTMERVFRTKAVVHVEDLWQDADGPGNPASKYGNARTYLGVPMLKDNELVGAIVIFRQEVRPFTDKQIELVKNFAAQAVIAIENTRLLNELRHRTNDLGEALEQQTATSEVLRVISSSPGDLQPVFEAMLANATRICEAKFGNLLLYEGNAFRVAAMHGAPPAWAELRRRDPILRFGPKNPLARIAETRRVQHIADFRTEPAYLDREPGPVALAEAANARTVLMVPMVKDGELIGIVAIYRQEVEPFTDKQIGLLTNFAAQAVIAIENTRLLNELRESLQRQTATSEVLQVISSSPGDLGPVFNSILANARRICAAKFAHLLLYDGRLFHAAAMEGASAAFFEFWQRGPHALDPETAPRRAVATKQVVHVPDLQQTERFRKPDPQLAALADLAGARSVLVVPLLKDEQVIGTLSIYREVPLPFSEKQIELVSNFADAGSHRHREHPPAQRVARIAAAADRHRRRAQGHQPIDVRPQVGAANTGRIRRPPL